MTKWRTFVSIVEGKCSLTLSVVVAPSGAHRLLVATTGVVCVLRRTYLAEDAKIADGELHSGGGGRVDVAEEGGEELAELVLGAEGDLVAVAVDIGQSDGVGGDVEEALDAGSEVIPSWGRLEDDHAGAAVELRELDVKLGGRHCAVLQESEGRLAENGGAYIGVGRVTAVGTWRCRNAAQGGGVVLGEAERCTSPCGTQPQNPNTVSPAFLGVGGEQAAAGIRVPLQSVP